MEYIPNFIFNLKNILVTWEQFAQSISTQYSCFENQGWFVTLKKIGHPAFWKKNRVQKTKVIVIPNVKRQPVLFSFWITMTLFFFASCFLQKRRVQKNRVFVNQKEKRPDYLFSFWITMTLVFCTLFFFQKSWCPIFLSGSQTDPGFQNKNSGYRLTGRMSERGQETILFSI